MTRSTLSCADVPLKSYSLAQSLISRRLASRVKENSQQLGFSESVSWSINEGVGVAAAASSKYKVLVWYHLQRGESSEADDMVSARALIGRLVQCVALRYVTLQSANGCPWQTGIREAR